MRTSFADETGRIPSRDTNAVNAAKTRGVPWSATLDGSGDVPRLCSRPGSEDKAHRQKEIDGEVPMLKIVVAALAALVFAAARRGAAQAYPSKPIRFVIPFGAGSATDALARIIGQELEQTLGQPIIVVPEARRRRRAGRRRGQARGARRLHLPVRHQQPARRRAEHAEGAALQRPHRFHADQLPRREHLLHRRPSVGARELARRAHRLRQGQPQAAELRGGQYLCLRLDGDVRDEQQDRARGDPLQVGARCDRRPAVGPRPAHERHLDIGRRAREGRQAEGPRDHRSTCAAR